MDIYEPAEDSYLLQKQVGIYAEGRVLDVGTGSGVQALTAVKNANVREVVALDINKKAIHELNQKIKQQKIRKIKAFESDLFSNVEGQFSCIIFNPPYLPQDKDIVDAALYGGKKGWEISAQFFAKVSKHLLPNGRILFLFSTLTNKNKIEELIGNNLLQFELLEKQKLAFEELYVYSITKTDLLRKLEGAGFEYIHYFDKGKRGMIYKAELDKSKLVKTHFPSKKNIVEVAIKVKNPDSLAQGRIENEIKWLKALNKHNVGPRLALTGGSFLAYRFVEGEFIVPWLENLDSGKMSVDLIKTVFNDLLQQCFTMDQLKVNKGEMHHPLKHVIVDQHNKPVLLDFERCSETDVPKNVTQLIEFICRLEKTLNDKGIKIDVQELRQLSAEYKDIYSQEVFNSIVRVFS